MLLRLKCFCPTSALGIINNCCSAGNLHHHKKFHLKQNRQKKIKRLDTTTTVYSLQLSPPRKASPFPKEKYNSHNPRLYSLSYERKAFQNPSSLGPHTRTMRNVWKFYFARNISPRAAIIARIERERGRNEITVYVLADGIMFGTSGGSIYQFM